jgi:hypothetical protein
VGGLLWSNNIINQKTPVLLTKLIGQFGNIKKYLSTNRSNSSPALVNSNSKTQGEVVLTK